MRTMSIRPRAFSRLLLSMLVLPVAVFAAGKTKTHTSSVPKGISLPEQKSDYAFFEGEKATKAGDFLKDEAQKERTFFCEKNTPNDKWWSTMVPYDKSRFGSRGANINLPWHSFTWDLKEAGLTSGIYDVFARVMVTRGGSCELGITTGNTVPKQTVKPKKINIFWQRVGSLEINAETQIIKLFMRTTKSAVILDTVLLVKAAPKVAQE